MYSQMAPGHPSDRWHGVSANRLYGFERFIVEVFVRDRAEAYAEAARTGAPAACQVADRFHLLQNRADVLTQVFTAHAPQLARLTTQRTAAPTPVPDPTYPASAPGPSSGPLAPPPASDRRAAAPRSRGARPARARSRCIPPISPVTGCWVYIGGNSATRTLPARTRSSTRGSAICRRVGMASLLRMRWTRHASRGARRRSQLPLGLLIWKGCRIIAHIRS